MSQNFCHKCGIAIEEDDLFCRKCGTPVNAKSPVKDDTKPRNPVPPAPQPLPPQPQVERAAPATIYRQMKYFSEDENHVNAECQNCGKVSKIPRQRCAPVSGGLSISPPVLCPCGTTYDMIDNVSSDYQRSAAGNVQASRLNIHPRQLNSTVEFADFIWKPSNKVYTTLNTNADAEATLARENWWQQARPQIMNELQKYMSEGWQPVTAPGADCWQCRVYKEPITKNWTAIGWMIYLIALFMFAFIPIIFLAFNNTCYEIVDFRVQLRRNIR